MARKILSQFLRSLKILFWLFLCLVLLTSSTLPPPSGDARVNLYTRPIEFDYVSWIADALAIKLDQLALGTSHYLSPQAQHDTVLQYLRLVDQIQQKESQLTDIYANPAIKDPQAASVDLRTQLQTLYAQRQELDPLAESIFQSQIDTVVSELRLSLGGQAIPPVSFHSTPLPMALIVSPRNLIRQDADISLVPDLPVDQQVKLENEVDKNLNVSSLVVPIGGVGVYPTMVQQTTDINWLAEVVSHEWTHNYLTWHPLGASYEANAQLRIINETTADIAGKEIGALLVKTDYPELAPPPPQPAPPTPPASNQPPPPPAFDYIAEMRITRVTVDKMLAEGKIGQAEAYMEARRLVFWEHGYHIRKINQAYFAFYGAYASSYSGQAGADPVGAAVRELRAESPSLAAFLHKIAWVTSFSQLEKLTNQK